MAVRTSAWPFAGVSVIRTPVMCLNQVEIVLVCLQLRERHARQRDRICVSIIDDSTGGGISCMT